MSEENTNTPANNSVASEVPANESPDLTLQDLAAIKSMIDVASSRGGFKPNEMVVVGSVYSKLEKFLEAAQKQAQAAQGQVPPNA